MGVGRVPAGYRRRPAGRAFLPADPAEFAALLDGFMLGKALYELAYELNNRPDWVRIPLRGILDLLLDGDAHRPADRTDGGDAS